VHLYNHKGYLNSIQFISYRPISHITEGFCLRGFYNLYTYFTSLTFDLTSDQEQLPRNINNPFTGEKRENPSGEQQRRIPLQDGQKNRRHVTRRNHYRVT